MHSYNSRVPIAGIFFLAVLAGCPMQRPLVIPAKPVSTEVTQKLDQGLRVLVEAARSKDPGAVERAAHEQHVPLEDGFVHLQITADKEESVPLIQKLITEAGGKVSTQLKVVVFALLPPAGIEDIAAHSEIWNMTLSPTAAVTRR